ELHAVAHRNHLHALHIVVVGARRRELCRNRRRHGVGLRGHWQRDESNEKNSGGATAKDVHKSSIWLEPASISIRPGPHLMQIPRQRTTFTIRIAAAMPLAQLHN